MSDSSGPDGEGDSGRPVLTGDLQPAAGEAPLAGRGHRLGAWVLDQIVVAVVLVPLIFVLDMDGELMRVVEGETPGLGLLLRLFVLQMAAYLALNGYLLGKYGQSIGKRLVGIRIVDAESRSLVPLSKLFPVRVLIPNAAYSLPSLGFPLMLVDLLVIFGQARRCVHDYLCGTLVEEAPRQAGA